MNNCCKYAPSHMARDKQRPIYCLPALSVDGAALVALGVDVRRKDLAVQHEIWLKKETKEKALRIIVEEIYDGSS